MHIFQLPQFWLVICFRNIPKIFHFSAPAISHIDPLIVFNYYTKSLILISFGILVMDTTLISLEHLVYMHANT